MWCPRCRTEYRPRFGRCADCEIPLVEELPDKPEPDLSEQHTADWVTVAELHTNTDSALLQSMLEAEGIPFVMMGAHQGLPGMDGGFIPTRFRVPPGEKDRTLSLVEQLAEGYKQ